MRAGQHRSESNRHQTAGMSETTPVTTRSTTDTLWRVIIIGIFVVAFLTAIGLPLLNGNWRSVFASVPVFAFGILIAAIRSIRPLR